MWAWLMSKIQSWGRSEGEEITGGGGGFNIYLFLLLILLMFDVGTWEKWGGWLYVWISSPYGGGGGGGF